MRRISPRNALPPVLAMAMLALMSLLPGTAVAQPAQPTSVRAVPRYDNPITLVLSWTDAATDEDNYEIERREVGGRGRS